MKDEHTIDIVRILLANDPGCISKTVSASTLQLDIPGFENPVGSLPLHLASSNVHHPGVAEYLFDVYPDAVLVRNGAGRLPIDLLHEANRNLSLDPYGIPINTEMRKRNLDLLEFLSKQVNCARFAQDRNLMSTDDFSGRLPLHQALYNRAPLGTIKLVYNGYPGALDEIGRRDGETALGIACKTGSVEVVKFLAEKRDGCLNIRDQATGEFPLHMACEFGNCAVVQYLLENHCGDIISVRNKEGKLPIQLFCEFVHDEMEGRGYDEYDPESTIFTETIWRLLLARVETVTNF